MEVKPGYKLTEVGIIPEQWEVAPLSREIEGLEAGVSVNSVDEKLRSYAHEQAVLKTSAVAGGQFLPHENKKIAPRDIRRAKLNPRFDTIIISRMNTPDLVGECGYVFANLPNLFLPDRLWMTRNRKESDVCVRWLSYLLSSKPYKTRIKGFATGTSGSMKNIAKDALLAMPISYPDGDEQCAISEALSDADALLGGMDRLIAKKRDLKQAAMQQLLTGQTRLPGFQGEWEVKRLGDHVKFLRNGVNSRAELRPEGRVKYLHYGDVHSCKDVCLSPASLPYLPDAKAASLDRLRDGDLIFADASEDLAGVSKSVEMRGVGSTEVVSGLHTIAARFEKKVLADGFKGFLQFCPPFATHLRRLAAGTKVYATNRAHIASVEMRLPMLPEQTAIAGVLSDMEDELIVLEARRDKTRDLKQAMMQELLTGKTRLVRAGAALA
jgi:type I restriction enzyme S subunit